MGGRVRLAGDGSVRFGLVLSRKCLRRDQLKELRAGHFTQHAGWQRIGQAVVVNVNVQPVHDVEVRVGKQLFQGSVAHLGAHAVLHEGLKVRARGQGMRILEGGQCRGWACVLQGRWGRRRCIGLGRCCNGRWRRVGWRRRGLNRFVLATGPAVEEAFAHAGPPLRLISVLTLTG